MQRPSLFTGRGWRSARKPWAKLHPDYAKSLQWLATIYQYQRDYTKAELTVKQGLAIRKKALGEAHPLYSDSLNQLANLYDEQGDYAKAEPLYRQALAIRKNALGEAHPLYAQSLNGLALLYRSQGDCLKAEPLLRQALVICEKNFTVTMGMQSERQQLAIEKLLRSNLDDYLSLTQTAGAAGNAADAYRHVLGWKGAVFSTQATARQARANPQFAPLFDELLSVSTRLATLSLAVPDPKKREVWLRQIGDLTNRKEDLERDLATKSAEFRQAQETASLTPEQLQRVLPKGTALVDFLEYTHSTPPPDRKGPVRARAKARRIRRTGRPSHRSDRPRPGRAARPRRRPLETIDLGLSRGAVESCTRDTAKWCRFVGVSGTSAAGTAVEPPATAPARRRCRDDFS